MFWSFCAPKAGVGTSVLAAAVAIEASKTVPTTVVDFGGDLAQILGVEVDGRHGVNDWLSATADVEPEALVHLHVEVAPNLTLLPAGTALPSSTVAVERAVALVEALRRSEHRVIADVGVLAGMGDPRAIMCVTGDRTTCVVRGCYLALRRFANLPVAVDDVVEIEEAGRALRTIDIEAVVGMAIAARIPFDPAISRVVDAGLLVSRLPRPLRRGVQDLLAGQSAAAVG